MMYSADDYAKDPTLFKPAWRTLWTPPPWLFDFQEKAGLMEGHGGRLMSFAHRADENRYYPENSLEAVLSCIAMGVDILELDVRISKDGVLIMSHDNTVTRCTDVREMRRKRPGRYPESDRIRDWTYKQLLELPVLDCQKRPTDYRLAKFEDVLRVCSGRIMMILDKLEETAEECGMTEPELWERCFFPLMERYDSAPSCVKGWHYRLEKSSILGEYEPGLREEWENRISSEPCFQKCIEGSTLNRENDRRELWREMDQIGVDYIMTNDSLGLVRYIAETYGRLYQ